jgi:RHS repeat-associated protein
MYDAVADPYCYPGTTVLKNLLDIRDQDTLDAFEAALTIQRADENGAVVERDAYDARRMAPGVLRSKRSTGTFRSPTAKRSSRGKRRNLDGSDDTTCSLASQTTRGFTGHEHIDSECLINANARIYDPTLGRFMSADSMMPSPFNGQAFNRYSYVNNNPLSMIDPSGHGGWGPPCIPAYFSGSRKMSSIVGMPDICYLGRYLLLYHAYL